MQRLFLVLFVIFTVLLGGCNNNVQRDNQLPQDKKLVEEPTISVYMHKTGETRQMKMEEYLYGVVAGEMKNDWDVEALAAQAIIARTYTLQSVEKGRLTAKGTQASTDIEEFQAYNAEAINDRVKQAVDLTRGKVATYGGSPIIGWFHASAGGKTALAKEGLAYKYGEPPYIQSVKSPDDLAPEDVQNCQAAFTQADVIKALDNPAITEIKTARIGQKGESGRAVSLVFNEVMEISAPSFRLAIGSTKLKSTLIDEIQVNDDEIVFSGKGYGHGVGLSQWGAQKMATEGKKAEDIVSYYFKGIKIEKRW